MDLNFHLKSCLILKSLIFWPISWIFNSKYHISRMHSSSTSWSKRSDSWSMNVDETYKLAVLTYKVRSASTPVYQHRWIAERASSRTLRSSAIPPRCWTNRSWEQTSLGVLSSFQHHLSVTRCYKQFSSVILCLFLNPHLKLFCSTRLLPNSDPTCHQRLWSYDCMTL